MRVKSVLKLTIESFLSVLRIIKYKSFLKIESLPEALEKDIYILGNGPSLKNNLEKHLEIIKVKKTFCVNNFCLSDYFIQVKPSYYILLDPAYYIRKNTSKKFLELQKNIIISLKNNVLWSLTLYIPKGTDILNEWNNLMHENKNIIIKFININPANGFRKFTFFLYKKNLAMPYIQNVLIGAIFVSLNMNYKNIYLFGADHSWTEDIRVNDKNQLCLVDKHFDGEDEEKLFYKGIENKELWKIDEILFAFHRTFSGYHILEDYSKFLNKNIFNATPNSYIDAFTRCMDLK